jgi:hypothetical protein
MSNREFNVIREHGVPVKISPTAHNVHKTILYTYDTRPTKANGEPNPWYKTSYPGMEALMRDTGVSRQSVERAITELIEKNIIDQVTLGKPGTRARYRPIYALGLLGEPVNLALHVSRNNGSSKRTKCVAPGMEMSKAIVQNESSTLSTISTTSIEKYDKYENGEIDQERWNVIDNYLKDDVKKYLTPGPNYEERLNKLERKGITPQAVGEFMAHQNWSTAYGIGGLFEYFLDVLLGVRKVGQSSCMPPHCKKCDPITRQFPEPSIGYDGKETWDCLTCSPTQVRLKNHLAEPHKSNVLELPSKNKKLAGALGSLNFDSAFRSVNE